MTGAEDGDGDWSVEDVRMESVELVPGGVGSSPVATGSWLAGLVGGVSISWRYRCPLVVASEFPSMAFTAGAGGGERDVCCTCHGLVVEGRWEEDWLIVGGGGGRSLPIADWTPSNCSPS